MRRETGENDKEISIILKKTKTGMDSRGPSYPLSQGEMVWQLVAEFIEIFSTGPDDIGCTSVVQHHIDMGKAQPICQSPYRLPIHRKAAVEKELVRMKEAGVVIPSKTPWASAAILVPKKDGSTRFCVDLRRLNEDNLAGSLRST